MTTLLSSTYSPLTRALLAIRVRVPSRIVYDHTVLPVDCDRMMKTPLGVMLHTVYGVPVSRSVKLPVDFATLRRPNVPVTYM
jgi:hypothetical protein